MYQINLKKKGKHNIMLAFKFIRTKGGTRTHTLLLASDFESDVSTNSTTLAKTGQQKYKIFFCNQLKIVGFMLLVSE